MSRLFVAIATLTLAFSGSSPLGASPSQEADVYLTNAVELIKKHHINSSEADWPRIESAARTQIATASSAADTYPVIRSILTALNERHSFFLEPRPVAIPGSVAGTHPSSPPMPSSEMVEGQFATLRLPELNTIIGENGQNLAREYTSIIRRAVEQMDKRSPCGWVIDLRANRGGNMWPMLLGLDPLLGDPPFGYFRFAAGPMPWVRANDDLMLGPGAYPVPQIEHGHESVAVIIGPQTASSGEMVAIALIGRHGVRTFGQSSAGFTTANEVHRLSDGAALVITVSTVTDRNRTGYAGPIKPDVETVPGAEEQAAHSWLAAQCS